MYLENLEKTVRVCDICYNERKAAIAADTAGGGEGGSEISKRRMTRKMTRPIAVSKLSATNTTTVTRKASNAGTCSLTLLFPSLFNFI